MALVLVGLIATVTLHARTRVEQQMHDALRTMVAWTAGMIEIGLPEGTQTLDSETLQAGSMELFGADTLLRFERLLGDATDQGLTDFSIVDRDGVILVSLDTREIGMLASAPRTPDEIDVYSERVPFSVSGGRLEGRQWLMHATAPVHNAAGDVVGWVCLTTGMQEIEGFSRRLRNTLAAIGAVIALLGLGSGWWLSTPLVQATHRLAAHAAGVERGEYTLFADRPRRRVQRRFLNRLSIRARLTITMVVILFLMVGLLQLVAIPIERLQAEEQLKEGLTAVAEWVGQTVSISLDGVLAGFPVQGIVSSQVLELTETLDPVRLQTLARYMGRDEVAYLALVDASGTIVFSEPAPLGDEPALVGKAPASRTWLRETTWRDQEVWVISTPIAYKDEPIATLQMGVYRTPVDAFLRESRTLFLLTGLIAVLAGILLAQAIGGAVTAPVRQLAADARRVGQGDLGVQFRASSDDPDSKDELSILAKAYNQMVVGLREREWLRELFGRFVSREVADALRNGQVRLAGERRLVSVFFCDIRGFTGRSEQHTPEEMVALLNEYLPIVVDAAQHYGGMVNKFGGDSTLIIYGAPRQQQESAYHAVLTALEVRAGLEALNVKLVARGEAPICIGTGINTGEVLAGAVGPEERQEYTVVGDTVNLASRIEDLNREYPEYDVLISGETYQALGARRAEFEFVDLGEKPIRGKAQPVRVWAVAKRRLGTTIRI